MVGSRMTTGRDADLGEECAILVRRGAYRVQRQGAFWLSQQPTHPGSVLIGSWLPRVVNWVRLEPCSGGRPISLYNAHFDYLPWAHTRSADILHRYMDEHWDGSPQILVGDFNAPQGGAAYADLMAGRRGLPGFVDAWTVARERVGPAETFHGGTGMGRWPGRIDHIFVRPSESVIRVCTITEHVGPAYPSDHFPVVAELAIAPAGSIPRAAHG
jgi:endonuclease/exonuclease/phosphatase family metal-dependent hydrolase